MRILSVLQVHRHSRPLFALGLWVLSAPVVSGQQVQIGRLAFPPGIVLLVEAGPPEGARPRTAHLQEEHSDLYLKARVNWDEDAESIPPGTPPNGFVAYLHIQAQVTNTLTNRRTAVTLLPQMSATEGTHYGRNFALPGNREEQYEVTVWVDPPDAFELSTHRDWRDRFERSTLFEPSESTFENVVFSAGRAEP